MSDEDVIPDRFDSACVRLTSGVVATIRFPDESGLDETVLLMKFVVSESEVNVGSFVEGNPAIEVCVCVCMRAPNNCISREPNIKLIET